MAIAALSPNSILATPAQVNPQVRTDLQTSVPQVTQETQKTAKTAQTDTITISAQALKMADDTTAVTKETADKKNEQEALQSVHDKAARVQSETQRNAVRAYAAVNTTP